MRARESSATGGGWACWIVASDLSAGARAAIEAETTSFPLPGLDRDVEVSWSSED